VSTPSRFGAYRDIVEVMCLFLLCFSHFYTSITTGVVGALMVDNFDCEGLTYRASWDRITLHAKENRWSMRGFDNLRDWELWKYCQGLEDDQELIGSIVGTPRGVNY
jgi:hypothetical protein